MAAKKKKTTIKGKSVETAPSKTPVKTVKKVPSKKSSPPRGKTAQPKVAAKMVKPAAKKDPVNTVEKKQASSPQAANLLHKEDSIRPLLQELENQVLKGQQEILVRLTALGKRIPKEPKEKAPKQKSPAPVTHDPLEGGVDSIRRLLSEMMEAHMESTVAELVSLRSQAASVPSGDTLLSALDRLLQELGVIAFTAERLDHLDPLIHTVVAERVAGDLPENRILETLQPGFRTSRGKVLARACVAVSQGE